MNQLCEQGKEARIVGSFKYPMCNKFMTKINSNKISLTLELSNLFP